MTRKQLPFILSALFILVCILVGVSCAHAAGFGETLDELKNTMEGISNFLSRIRTITSIAGFSTIVLFLFVLFFSAGLTALGIPRGSASLLFSLLVADFFWVLWETSFHQFTPAFMLRMAKANGIILFPLMSLLMIKRFAPVLARKLRRWIRSLRKKKTMTGKEALALVEELHRESGNLELALMRDPGSPEAAEYARRLRELISRL